MKTDSTQIGNAMKNKALHGRKRRLIGWKGAVLSVCLWIFWTSPAWAKLHFGPYLQSVERDSVLVCAHFDDTDKARVSVLLEDGTKKSVPLEGHEPACARFAELTPDIEYPYQFFINEKPVLDEPLPAFVAGTDSNHTFVIMGDTRSGDDSFDVSHRQIVRTIRSFSLPDALIHTGDFIEEGERFDLWQNFFRIEEDLLRTTVLFPSIGRSDQPAEWMAKLFPVLKKSPWYSFDRGQVHISVLKIWQDYSQPEEEVGGSGPQLSWLRQDLENARKNGAEYLFVVLHQPIFDVDGENPEVAKKHLMPLFERQGVTAVFSGAHFFSHIERNGVHYFTNGGGGAVLEKRLPPEGIFRFYSAIHHYLLLEIGYFGARAKAIDNQGNEFYLVDFDKKTKTAAKIASDASTVHDFAPKSSPAKEDIVSFSVYFSGEESEKDKLFSLLREIAARTGKTLRVTFRSAVSASGRASLVALGIKETQLPAAVVRDHVLSGWTVLRSGLPDALEAAPATADERDADTLRMLLALGVTLAGLILFASVLIVLRKKRKQTATGVGIDK